MYISISVDAMGGDMGPVPILLASFEALDLYKELHLHVVGDESLLRSIMKDHHLKNDRLHIHMAKEVISMHEDPLVAMSKHDSSMYTAVSLVHKKITSACISCGNTGALTVISYRLLRLFNGISRPAIMGRLPSANARGSVYMLDIGANIYAHAEHLVQYAVMGSAYMHKVYSIERPRVALLNIGKEKIKGVKSVRDADKILSDFKSINYIGFIEGDQILFEEVDVIVTDGFVANILIKTLEGSHRFLLEKVYKNIFTRFLYYVFGKNNPQNYNGACLIGLNGVVIKSHGNATKVAFLQAIKHAISMVRSQSITYIAQQVSHFVNQIEGVYEK